MTASRRALLLSTAGISGAVLGTGVVAAPEAEADSYAVVPGTTKALGGVIGATTLDLSVADTFTCTVTGPTQFTFGYSGTVPSTPGTIEPVLILTQDSVGFRAVSFFQKDGSTSVNWMPAGSGPAVAMGAGATSILSFLTPDFGTTVYGQGAAGNGLGVYGDGSDGVVILDGTQNPYPFLGFSASSHDYWLLRDIYPSALTLAPNIALQVAGGGSPPFRIYCKGAVTVPSGSSIWSLPNATATASTVGTNMSTGTLPPGCTSYSGTKTAGTAGANAVGGLPTSTNAPTGSAVKANAVAGGGGGAGVGSTGSAVAGGAGGSALAPSGLSLPSGTAVLPRTLAQAVSMAVTDGTGAVHSFTGGAAGGAGGGDGTNLGGAGGPGGNPLFIAAQTIVNNGSIFANGGHGGTPASGNTGGGGGGQGGPVVLIYSSYSGTGTVQSNGGAGGKAAGSGAPGTAGGPGWIVELQN